MCLAGVRHRAHQGVWIVLLQQVPATQREVGLPLGTRQALQDWDTGTRCGWRRQFCFASVAVSETHERQVTAVHSTWHASQCLADSTSVYTRKLSAAS